MTIANADITFERLQKVLHYDPLTGVFRWRVTLTPRALVGEIAGSLKSSGYVCINIDGQRYRAHRLAWLYMTGKHPAQMVDHRDTVRNHNWWANLRLANNQQNGANSKRKHYGTSGHKGVYWCKQKQKWGAKVTVSGKQIHLGFHAEKIDAAKAYALGAKEHFGDFARYDAPIINFTALRAAIASEHAAREAVAALQARLLHYG